MAKVDADTAVEEIEEVEDTNGEETKEKRKREKWGGGYELIFDDVESCKDNPVLSEAGEVNDEDFAVYKIFDEKVTKDDKGKETVEELNLCYSWARNNGEAMLNWLDVNTDLRAVKLDGKRGRRKVFKPDANIEMLAMSLKEAGDAKGIARFLEHLPAYSYIFNPEQVAG